MVVGKVGRPGLAVPRHFCRNKPEYLRRDRVIHPKLSLLGTLRLGRICDRLSRRRRPETTRECYRQPLPSLQRRCVLRRTWRRQDASLRFAQDHAAAGCRCRDS